MNISFLGLLLFTALLLLRPGDFFPIFSYLHIVRLVAGATIGIFIITQTQSHRPLIKKYPQFWQLTLLLIIMAFSITTSIWKSHSLASFIEFLKLYAAFILIIGLINSIKRFKNVIWVMVLSGTLIGLLSLSSYLKAGYIGTDYRMRSINQGMFADSNELALGFIMLIPYAYFLLLEKGNLFKKIFLISVLVVYLAAVVFTFSRGGILGLIVVLIFLFLKSKNKLKALIGLSLAAYLFISFAPQSYLERIKTIPTSNKDDPSAISRLDAWKAGVAMMKQNILGVGVGNFGEAFVTYRAPEAVDFPGMRRAAHNAFIQIGGEAGILALGLFVLLILTSLSYLQSAKKIVRRLKTKEADIISRLSDATMISLIGFITCAFFLSQAYNWFLYYLFAYSVVLKELSKKYAQSSI